MIEKKIQQAVSESMKELFGANITSDSVAVQTTRKEFAGDFTVVVFPFLQYSKMTPEATAHKIGEWMKNKVQEISDFSVVKGFLNLNVSTSYFLNFLSSFSTDDHFGYQSPSEESEKIVIEYSSPNTNKPLHLGHIRNNLLGYSLAEILKANGKHVVKVNLVNDRGIHICKSMLAWQKWGNNETPESTGIKGDHLVGKYYVMFETKNKAELKSLVDQGLIEDDAETETPLMQEAREMLQKWEALDDEVMELWHKMNQWVYEGFEKTYTRMGIDFDKVYYESDTYLLGKEIVEEGLANGFLKRSPDGAIWADLTAEGLDEKLLLRADGTSVYITQDLGTACLRHKEYQADKMIYVVGSEQIYHFDVLKKVLKKLGYDWADTILHYSYGMVELPDGKMKSREGKVVDADDLLDEMFNTAKQMTIELGKSGNLSQNEANTLYNQIGLGALKYFILKVDPKKNMMFNPAESVDFNGNTGPFIQYTHARICSVLSKAGKLKNYSYVVSENYSPSDKEKQLLKVLHQFPLVVKQAGDELSPALLANYTYDLAKEFNQFYHDYSILSAETPEAVEFRLALSAFTGKVIKNAMKLLGIEVPERM